MEERPTDRGIADLKERMDERFALVDARFELIDKRFDDISAEFRRIDKRFENVETDIRGIRGDIKSMQRNMLYGFMTLAGMIAAFQAF
ncbi:MAG TPA: hypothetical protein VF009_11120 [Solirubrobacterales bacterium]